MGEETCKGRDQQGLKLMKLWTWREEGPGPAAWVGDGRQCLRYDPRKQERKQVWKGWWGVEIQHTVPPNRDTPQTFQACSRWGQTSAPPLSFTRVQRSCEDQPSWGKAEARGTAELQESLSLP